MQLDSSKFPEEVGLESAITEDGEVLVSRKDLYSLFKHISISTEIDAIDQQSTVKEATRMVMILRFMILLTYLPTLLGKSYKKDDDDMWVPVNMIKDVTKDWKEKDPVDLFAGSLDLLSEDTEEEGETEVKKEMKRAVEGKNIFVKEEVEEVLGFMEGLMGNISDDPIQPLKDLL